jgi:hypothetical protein
VTKSDRALTISHYKAIALLFEGNSIIDVAKQVGKDKRTIHRWLKDTKFQSVLQDKKDETFTKIFEKFINRIDGAGNVIKEIMLDKNAPYSVRLRAADLALKYGNAAFQDLEMAREIRKIQERLDRRDEWEEID